MMLLRLSVRLIWLSLYSILMYFPQRLIYSGSRKRLRKVAGHSLIFTTTVKVQKVGTVRGCPWSITSFPKRWFSCFLIWLLIMGWMILRSHVSLLLSESSSILLSPYQVLWNIYVHEGGRGMMGSETILLGFGITAANLSQTSFLTMTGC